MAESGERIGILAADANVNASGRESGGNCLGSECNEKSSYTAQGTWCWRVRGRAPTQETEELSVMKGGPRDHSVPQNHVN